MPTTASQSEFLTWQSRQQWSEVQVKLHKLYLNHQVHLFSA
uniref:Uncharacterized protein n=1 Tax=Arundo donax TaxID=35708 RepID=A0A0A9EBJ7_ARUDO